MFDLSHEIAVVIGGTGVLGGALCDGLAGAGAQVAVLGRNQERGQARVAAITAAGGRAVFVSCDAGDPASLKAAHQEVASVLGALLRAGEVPQASAVEAQLQAAPLSARHLAVFVPELLSYDQLVQEVVA